MHTVAPVAIEVDQLAVQPFAFDQSLEEERSVSLRIGEGVEVGEDVLDELVNGHRGRRNLVCFGFAQRALAVFVGEEELADADGDHGRGNEHHHDHCVLPDEPAAPWRGRRHLRLHVCEPYR